MPFNRDMHMPRCLAALAALLLVACVVEREPERDGSSFEYSGDDAVELDESVPAHLIVEVEPDVAAPSPMDGDDTVEPTVEPEPAPSAPAPSDEPELVPTLPRQISRLSPATRDDEPAAEPAPSAPAPSDEPAAEVGTVEGGDLCTVDAECVPGLACAEVWQVVEGGLLLLDERRCGYVAP